MEYPDFTQEKAKEFFLDGGEHGIILVHGFTGGPGHMRPMGEALNQAGYTVQGLRLAGHCETLEEMERYTGQHWLEQVETAFLEMKETHATVTLGGLSMGGLICLRLAEMHPVDSLLLFAPCLRFRAWTNNLAPLVKHFMKRKDWKTPPLQKDPRFLKEYDICYASAPVTKVEEMMKLIRRTRPHLGRITCPTLVVQSRHDESVHPRVPEKICQGISSEVREILWLDESPHVLTLGADREQVFTCCKDFLRRAHG